MGKTMLMQKSHERDDKIFLIDCGRLKIKYLDCEK